MMWASDELDGVVHESAHLPVAGVRPRAGMAATVGPSDWLCQPSSTWCATSTPVKQTEWLYLGDGHHGLEVSPETAQRLRWAIGRLMEAKAEFR